MGSETDGSIVSPSSSCGIVGIKPTVGLLSRAGIIPISHTQDTAGPMARTVADAALLLGAMTGVDERDAATRASRGKALSDYTQFLDPKGLQGARIGVYRPHSLDKNPLTTPILAEALAAMRAAGATIVDPVKVPSEGKSGNGEYQVLLYEFKADLNRYLAELGPQAPVHTLKEAIEFNERHRDRVMPYFGQEIFLEAEAKGPLTEAAYKKALAACRLHSRQEGIDAVLARHKLDAVVAPTHGPAWLIDLVNGDSGSGGSSSLAAVSGYPSLTVPAGFVFGLPVGISFIGARLERARADQARLRLRDRRRRSASRRVSCRRRSLRPHEENPRRRLGLVLALLVAVLLLRMILIKSHQVQRAAEPVTDLTIDARGAAGRLAAAVRFPTISHESGEKVEAAAFQGLHQYLQQTFPRVHAALTRETVGGYSLLYTWKGRRLELAPVLLLSHQDVVPVEPGTERAWTHPAFSGLDGRRLGLGPGHARRQGGGDGASSKRPRRSSAAASSRTAPSTSPSATTRRWAGQGAAAMASLLERRGVRPAFILDEGGAIVEGIDAGRPAAGRDGGHGRKGDAERRAGGRERRGALLHAAPARRHRQARRRDREARGPSDAGAARRRHPPLLPVPGSRDALRSPPGCSPTSGSSRRCSSGRPMPTRRATPACAPPRRRRSSRAASRRTSSPTRPARW